MTIERVTQAIRESFPRYYEHAHKSLKMLRMMPKTNKDSIERSAPGMFGSQGEVNARSLNAIRG